MIKKLLKLFHKEPAKPEVLEEKLIEYTLTDVYVLRIYSQQYCAIALKHLTELGYHIHSAKNLTAFDKQYVYQNSSSHIYTNHVIHEKYCALMGDYTIYAMLPGIALGEVKKHKGQYALFSRESQIARTPHLINILMTSPEDELPDIKIKLMSAEEEARRIEYNAKQEKLLVQSQIEQEKFLEQERLNNIRKLL